MDYSSERSNLVRKVLSLDSESQWEELALEIFRFQSKYNDIYRKFVELLHIEPGTIDNVDLIPCIPVEFYKHHAIISGQWDPVKVFKSSGTTGQIRSNHYVRDLDLYHKVTVSCFENEFGPLTRYSLIAVLPSYQENPDSSLLEMIDHFIHLTRTEISRYYLPEKAEIRVAVQNSQKAGRKPLIFGVSYALMDLAEQGLDLSNCYIIETGGMKGRRKEMLKSDLHAYLKNRLLAKIIYSEYGMAELFAQAYSKENGIFNNSVYLKTRSKEVNDPLALEKIGKTGIMECIDLSNIDTCSFVQTQDLGRNLNEEQFEIIGRLQNADLRGCNLLYDEWKA